MDTPVVFIIFNRPDLAAKVLAAIAQARPKLLLVVADGPRAYRPEEAEKCRQTRALLDTIDWPCEVRCNFAQGNLGCRRRVSSGLDWVFEQVDQAIILEDDCLPHPSFFGYCEQLLNRYRDEPRVMQISGNNFQPDGWACPHSYYFSKYMHVWGWATWRRAWRLYDVNTALWPVFKASNRLAEICPDPFERAMWRRYFENIHAGCTDTWDTQWIFACWQQQALSIAPAVNLVSNIGFRADATHTTWQTRMAERPAADIGDAGKFRHPPQIVAGLKEDGSDFLEVYNGRSFTRRNRLFRRLLRLPGRMVGRSHSELDLWK